MAKDNRYSQLAPDGAQKVVDIAGPRVAKPSSGFSIDSKDGALRLVMGRNSVPVDVWSDFPLLMPALQEAFATWTPGKSWATVKSQVFDLNRGLLAFLKDRFDANGVEVASLDQEAMGEFKKWLGARLPDGEARWKQSTQAKLFATMKMLVGQWRSSKRFKALVPKDLQLEVEHFHGRKVGMKPVKVIDDQSLQSVMRAALAECRSTRAEVESAWRELDDESLCEDEASRLLREARLKYKACHEGVLPTSQWLRTNDSKFWEKLLGPAKKIDADLAALRRPYMPTGRDLIPFVLLLAFYTGFNPEALRSIKLRDVDWPDGLGGKRVRFSPFKGRSGRSQIRTFPVGDPDGPAAMIQFLNKWGELIRSRGNPEEASHLFVMVAPADNTGAASARCAVFSPEGGSQTRWGWNFRKFIEENGLPGFTLAQVRKTSLDLVHEMTGGDLKAVAVAGGQRSAQTIEDHYMSDAARVRNSERLGGIMATRERWIGSEGAAADPRTEPRSADMGAATPGFHCLDPFASPIGGEIEGRLCQAYGACPKCPLAYVRRDDPYVLARLIQLRKEIASAQAELDANRWRAAWKPVLDRLDQHWIPACASEEVMREASNLTLPSLPPLE